MMSKVLSDKLFYLLIFADLSIIIKIIAGENRNAFSKLYIIDIYDSSYEIIFIFEGLTNMFRFQN